MNSVFDVADYILGRIGSLPIWKLHKLLYYSQAWSLAWDNEPLFKEKIEAWMDSPVCRDLYDRHKGQLRIARVDGGNADKLTEDQKESVDAILSYYGKIESHWLSNLIHSETPWQLARKGMSPRDQGNSEITHESMAAFYSSIDP